MAKRFLNVGLVGYQFMGKAHSNAYRQVAHFFPELELVPALKAICGRNEAAVADAAGQLGWQSYETDWRRLIERSDIDLIDVSTPGNLHAEIAIAAAQAGKHVLCEKPLGNTASEARRMLDAAVSAGIRHGVFFNYRKVPAVALAKQLIDSGTLGRVYHWRATYLQDWIADPAFPMVWRLDKESAGTGAHGDLNAHLVDLARFLVGEITEVSGMMETFIKQRPQSPSGDAPSADPGVERPMGNVTVDDATLFLARFDSGALGSFEATRFALGRKNYNRFEINGSGGSIAFNLERLDELEVYTEETRQGTYGFRTVSVTTGDDPYSGHFWPAGHNIGYGETFIGLIADAFGAISRGESPSPSFNDGYRNNAVLDAVVESAELKKWVTVTY